MEESVSRLRISAARSHVASSCRIAKRKLAFTLQINGTEKRVWSTIACFRALFRTIETPSNVLGSAQVIPGSWVLYLNPALLESPLGGDEMCRAQVAANAGSGVSESLGQEDRKHR